jgi:hypothetical protein
MCRTIVKDGSDLWQWALALEQGVRLTPVGQESLRMAAPSLDPKDLTERTWVAGPTIEPPLRPTNGKNR